MYSVAYVCIQFRTGERLQQQLVAVGSADGHLRTVGRHFGIARHRPTLVQAGREGDHAEA